MSLKMGRQIFTRQMEGLSTGRHRRHKNKNRKISFENCYKFATKRGTKKFDPAYDSPSRPVLK